MDGFTGEAYAICREYGWTTPDDLERVEHALRHEAFMRATEPLQRRKADLCGLFLRRVVVGGTPEQTEYEWASPEAPKAIAAIDDWIMEVAKQHGLPVHPPAPRRG